uniref:Uncharacterized protein n=1 Tax=Hemiselmis andersenii TaxID=464988 RepID=A0A6T8IBB9_HEMAN|mmetsp:Transcript_8759/g.21483  ORF Transcript_8759/g.21483 Transcript_8759/m.21483 type:complete len:302 (-) Transcript_8759:111-1016(-)
MLVEENTIKVESKLYNDLKRDMGAKNFELYCQTVNAIEWKKKGPYVPPEADMGSKRNAKSFPPLLSRWSLRQTKEVVKDTGKIIRITGGTKEWLTSQIGEKRVNIIKDNIGFDERPGRDYVAEKDITVFKTAWGQQATLPKYELNGTWTIQRPHPVYKDSVKLTDMATIQLGKLDDDRRNLVGVGTTVPAIAGFRRKEGPQGPHPSKVNGKFYWPHMANSNAAIPFTVEKVSGVNDLSQWLKYYGEPNPDKIKNATMTTFEPIAKIVAGGRSQGRNAVTKVDGRTWKKEFDQTRSKQLGIE